MTFNHNDHYHSLLMRQVPPGCQRALDVGCGTGRFARRLAAAGIHVDAIDASAEVIRAAEAISSQDPGPVQPHYEQADIGQVALPAGHYDYIAALASLHHMEFATLSKLRAALRPGGVLALLGCYRSANWSDYVLNAIAVPANAVLRSGLAARSRLAPGSQAGVARVNAPTRPAAMTLAGIRHEGRQLLPGCSVRRLLFWRYLLVYHAPASHSEQPSTFSRIE